MLRAISKILLPTPDGNQVPLGSVAAVALHNGAYTIYREGGRRYIPIKFSVRGRDLKSTIRNPDRDDNSDSDDDMTPASPA